MIWVPTPSALLQRERELDRALISPLDLEWEARRAASYRYVVDGGRVRRVRAVGGGTFTTGTQAETLYSNRQAGTAKNTFTTEAQLNDTAGMGPVAVVKQAVWRDMVDLTTTLRFTARGILSSTATPTYTFATRFGTSSAGALIGGTAALTTLTTITNKGFEMEWDVQLVTKAAAGANSTVRGAGLLSCPAGLASPGVYEVWGTAAQPGTVATVDTSIDNLIWFGVACSASSASNGLTLLQLIIQGLAP